MSSHQSTSYSLSEDGAIVAQEPLNAKEIMKLLKRFSSLGTLHSKINFIFTCLVFALIPKGFRLKWTEQTGFADGTLKENVNICLNKTSSQLQRIVLTASFYAFNAELTELLTLKSRFLLMIGQRL